MRKSVLLTGVGLLVALLPGAALTAPVSSSVPTPTPTVTIPPVFPLPAQAVSKKERDEAMAREIRKSYAPHFNCRTYREDGLLWQDLIPTANVTAQIMFDQRTHSNEVIVADPRIVISHRVFVNHVKLEPNADWKTVAQDTYSWTYTGGTEHFDVYAYGSVTGKPRWHRIDPSFNLQPDEHGVYEMSLGREPNSGILIVATDTSTCKDGNRTPKGLWKSLGYNVS